MFSHIFSKVGDTVGKKTRLSTALDFQITDTVPSSGHPVRVQPLWDSSQFTLTLYEMRAAVLIFRMNETRYLYGLLSCNETSEGASRLIVGLLVIQYESKVHIF